MSNKLEKILEGIVPEELGKSIELARKSLGFSMTELGERIGVTHVTILSHEKGEKLSVQTLVALAKELNDSFNVTYLQEHLNKYSKTQNDLNVIMDRKIRKIFDEEFKTRVKQLENGKPNPDKDLESESEKLKKLNTGQELATKSKNKTLIEKEETDKIHKKAG